MCVKTKEKKSKVIIGSAGRGNTPPKMVILFGAGPYWAGKSRAIDFWG
jgi:hypothetical protein